VLKKCINRNTHGFIEGTIDDAIVTQNGKNVLPFDYLGMYVVSFNQMYVLCSAENWRTTKRLMQPAFALSMLTQYLLVFNEQSRILVDVLKTKAKSGEVFDFWSYVINANIDIITGKKLKVSLICISIVVVISIHFDFCEENMMGIKSNCQTNRDNEYSEAFLK